MGRTEATAQEATAPGATALSPATARRAPSQGIGHVHESYTAKVDPTIEGAQDGGVVSALLISLLEAGEIDGALVARESGDEPWKGEAFLARTPEEVRESAGSFYNQTLALAHVDFEGYGCRPTRVSRSSGRRARSRA